MVSVRTVLAVLSVVACAQAARHFHHGRPRGGMMNAPMLSRFESVEREALAAGVKLPEAQWFNQTLDHFNPQDTRMFKQQYQVNATYYKAGGPVFLLLGGEGPASPVWLFIDTAIMVYAQKFNAVVVQLEHRFYGKTQPFKDLATENLRYLSSEQALADAAVFLASMETTLNVPADSKVIVFGGSYSGALAAFFRTKYPHMAAGAIASSAPVLAELNFVAYHEVVQASLLTTANGTTCINNIKAATAQIEEYLKSSNGTQKVIKDFNVCKSKLNNQNDIENFFSSLASNIDGVVQYNKDNRDFEGGPVPPTIDDVCAIVGADGDAYTLYAQLNAYLLNATGQTCLDASYEEMIKELQDTSLTGPQAEGGRQWTYQTCVEFGFYQSSDSNNQPFGHDFPLLFSTQQCKEVYGIVGPNIAWTNEYYGGLNISGTNILYPNGNIDPWHALGFTTSAPNAQTQAFYINGTAHCANMYPPSDNDVQGLKDCRTAEVAAITAWLA